MNTPIPLNELDRTIMAMQKSQAVFPDFCRAVCEGELWALIPYHPEVEGGQIENKTGAPFPFALLKEEKGLAVPVFSSSARADEGLAKGRIRAKTYSVCALQAMVLLSILGSTKFGAIINKGCASGSITIWPDLMRDLVSGVAFKTNALSRENEIQVKLTPLDPADYPTDLVQRAFESLRRHKNFRAAWVFGGEKDGKRGYHLLTLMEPRDEAIYHDFNLTVHSNHNQAYGIFLGLLDERDKAYVENFFRQAKPFYVAADYPLPPGAKV
jgi:hypothetical protein